jgi:GTP-binding protein HflX
LTRQLAIVSFEIQKQIAVLITRKGAVTHVVVGDNKRIWLPDIGRFRTGPGRLLGLRCVHTHLHGEPLSDEDLTDLILLGLDLMVCIHLSENGLPGPISYAHILAESNKNRGCEISRVPDIGQLHLNFKAFIQSLEDEIARTDKPKSLVKKERAILVGITTGPTRDQWEALEELKALAISNTLEVVDMVVQRIKEVQSKFLIGKGRLSELALRCLQTGSNLLIFDNELTPTQVRSLTDFTELKIIDRSQLILDIFANRAVTREGKIQVELAQLKYLLPRLATKNTAMSRLTGGIGGRGPGETKLEINRRRARERIARLNRELTKIQKQRQDRRRLRNIKGLPVISIVGYTNAGKSTLLNALTHSHVSAGSRLFETLDPSSRRLRFPREREAIITDTVGFIRNLPESLMEAFASTLEELQDADLLLHVVDASSPRMEEEIETVQNILIRLGLKEVPCLLVLNKMDLIEKSDAIGLFQRRGGIPISAVDRTTFQPLLSRIEQFLWSQKGIEASDHMPHISVG